MDVPSLVIAIVSALGQPHQRYTRMRRTRPLKRQTRSPAWRTTFTLGSMNGDREFRDMSWAGGYDPQCGFVLTSVGLTDAHSATLLSNDEHESERHDLGRVRSRRFATAQSHFAAASFAEKRDLLPLASACLVHWSSELGEPPGCRLSAFPPHRSRRRLSGKRYVLLRFAWRSSTLVDALPCSTFTGRRRDQRQLSGTVGGQLVDQARRVGVDDLERDIGKPQCCALPASLWVVRRHLNAKRW